VVYLLREDRAKPAGNPLKKNKNKEKKNIYLTVRQKGHSPLLFLIAFFDDFFNSRYTNQVWLRPTTAVVDQRLSILKKKTLDYLKKK
jgi:hypothetical protein